MGGEETEVAYISQVTDILPYTTDDGENMFEIRTNNSLLQQNPAFDTVFFAAPWHLSPMSKSMNHFFQEEIPYVALLV